MTFAARFKKKTEISSEHQRREHFGITNYMIEASLLRYKSRGMHHKIFWLSKIFNYSRVCVGKTAYSEALSDSPW